MKKIVTALFSLALLLGPLSFSLQAEASTLNQLVPTSPADSGSGGIQPYGAKPPKGSASTHDLSKGFYSYEVEKVGAQVYTDKFLKGKTTMSVTVNNWKVLNDFGGTNNALTITVYNSSGTQVASKKLTMNYTSAVANFSGLKASTKYYVKFSVPTNGNSYKFNGVIY